MQVQHHDYCHRLRKSERNFAADFNEHMENIVFASDQTRLVFGDLTGSNRRPAIEEAAKKRAEMQKVK